MAIKTLGIFGLDEAIYEIIEPESLWFEIAETYDEAIRVGGNPTVKSYRVLKIQGFYSISLETELVTILAEEITEKSFK